MDNITSSHTLSPMDIAVGTVYITEAVVVIFFHILCSHLMYTDKKMKNPTYYFMINLSLVDCVELSMAGIYAGIIILTRWHNNLLARFASFLCLAMWYTNCILFGLIAFARWVAITRPHLTRVIFKRAILWSLQAASWIIPCSVCFYSNVLYTPGPVFPFVPDFYTWDFDTTSSLGLDFSYGNIGFNATCTIFEMGFNILSLFWVHQTRKQVQNLSTAENRRREVKLLIQCFILGCVFTSTYIIFTTVYAFPQIVTVGMCLCVQGVWTLNHSVNPIVYLSVNKKLRQRAIKFLTRGKFGLVDTTTTGVSTTVKHTGKQSLAK